MGTSIDLLTYNDTVTINYVVCANNSVTPTGTPTE